MKLYHTTHKKNLSSIKQLGLIPSKFGIVYLSERPNSWWQDNEHVTLEVNMDNFPYRLSTFGLPELDEVLCWGSIEPWRIKERKKRRET